MHTLPILELILFENASTKVSFGVSVIASFLKKMKFFYISKKNKSLWHLKIEKNNTFCLQ